MKEDGDFAEIDYELKMLWDTIGKFNKALKKLNNGEILEESDFPYWANARDCEYGKLGKARGFKRVIALHSSQ